MKKKRLIRGINHFLGLLLFVWIIFFVQIYFYDTGDTNKYSSKLGAFFVAMIFSSVEVLSLSIGNYIALLIYGEWLDTEKENTILKLEIITTTLTVLVYFGTQLRTILIEAGVISYPIDLVVFGFGISWIVFKVYKFFIQRTL